MSVSIKKISEVDSSQLFEHKELLLGDKNGKFVIVDNDDGIIYARYKDWLKAKEHCDILNDPTPTGLENLTVEELIDKCEKICKEAEKFLEDLK